MKFLIFVYLMCFMLRFLTNSMVDKYFYDDHFLVPVTLKISLNMKKWLINLYLFTKAIMHSLWSFWSFPFSYLDRQQLTLCSPLRAEPWALRDDGLFVSPTSGAMPYIWTAVSKCLIMEETLFLLLHMGLGFIIYYKFYTNSKSCYF